MIVILLAICATGLRLFQVSGKSVETLLSILHHFHFSLPKFYVLWHGMQGFIFI